ncbi:MAG: hypothetical protein RI637_06580, partial [Acidimicrobiia bacterium]|nr:hypothetical protein [Acidimicrobiia bacterium]
MRFTVRPGKDPVAGADRTLLAAMGMPGGGIISVGTTHVLVRPRETSEPTALLLGPQALSNAGLTPGRGVDAKRAILPAARRVVIEGDKLPLETRTLVHGLQGRPVSAGDHITVADFEDLLDNGSCLGLNVGFLLSHVRRHFHSA